MYRFNFTNFIWFLLDNVRGGFANAFSTVSKYEINPEEIKINFSDVRGVRNLDLKFFVHDFIRLMKQKMN